MSDTAHAVDIDGHVRVYLIVFASLAVLTSATVGVHYLFLPIGPAVAIGLFIATIKATLVACYFMHLISEKRVIFLVLLITGVFLLGLFVLTMSSFYDQAGGHLVS